MRNRGSVRSFSESHRAKATRPDRRIFLPRTRWLPSAAHFSGQLHQLRSTVPNSPPTVPNFPTPVPIFPATLPNAKAPVPILRMAVLNFPAIFPNFSPPAPICNALFPSHLGAIAAKNRVGRVTPCAPFSRNPAPARRGLTRPTCGVLTFNEIHP